MRLDFLTSNVFEMYLDVLKCLKRGAYNVSNEFVW